MKLGNTTTMLEDIKPGVAWVEYAGDRISKNEEFVHMACESNVRHTMEQIRQRRPILKDMEDNGEIRIAGAVYDMDNGRVAFLDKE